VKQQYWIFVAMQQAKAGDDGRVRLYGKGTHAELCRWVGVTPNLFRNRKKAGSQ